MKPRIGRWYKYNGGIGLEIETGNTDPDFAWISTAEIEKRGRSFQAMFGSGEAIGTGYGVEIGYGFPTLEKAQEAVVRALRCKIVPRVEAA